MMLLLHLLTQRDEQALLELITVTLELPLKNKVDIGISSCKVSLPSFWWCFICELKLWAQGGLPEFAGSNQARENSFSEILPNSPLWLHSIESSTAGTLKRKRGDYSMDVALGEGEGSSGSNWPSLFSSSWHPYIICSVVGPSSLG